MVMTASEGTAAAGVHERMPVLLAADDQTRWVDGSPDEALGLCRGWQGPITIEATSDPWAKGAAHQPGLFQPI
jgi:putative SOS response-associated peptidase YedK